MDHVSFLENRKMSLEYALVTSSSLPNEVRESEYYTEVDKAQWLDLVDYCQNISAEDSSQSISFLIVAKGTEEQESADQSRRQSEESALASKAEREKAAAAEQKAADFAASAARQERQKLRDRSKSIFNALYRR